MKIHFAKMHGLGNDFVVLDGVRRRLPALSAALARQVADRRRGIGCDQLLILQPDKSGKADFFYRIFNADGGEVGQCGNGARCAHIFLRRRKITNKKMLRLRTVTTAMETILQNENTVRAVMQKPVFEGEKKAGGHLFHLLNLGNPHAVSFKPANEAALLRLAATLNKQMPDGVNVGVGKAEKTRITLQVCERGSGITAACGSGALAAAAAAIRRGLSNNPARVVMAGGTLLCGLDQNGNAYLEGEVAHSFNGVFTWQNGKLSA